MKLGILFVDDDVNVIHGLKRMLRVMRSEWDFYFSDSGEKALEIMSENAIHVIISDMRMPNMNGAELLSIVKEKYPSTIRIILSGQSNEELALQSTQTAHRFIAKPVEASELKNTIQQAQKLYNFLKDENLRKVINGINELPTLPQMFFEIEREFAKENISLQKISEIIETDVIISAKILQIVNSAFFGLPQNVSSVSQAVNLIGVNIIKSLLVYINVFNSTEKNKRLENILTNIWDHSLKVAICSKKISAEIGNDKEQNELTYLAGLLHDIGKIVLLSNNDLSGKILSKMEDENVNYNVAESEVVDTNHSLIGAYLLSLWGLSDAVSSAAQYHHDKIKVNSSLEEIYEIVFLANLGVNDNKIFNDFVEEKKIIDKYPNLKNICE